LVQAARELSDNAIATEAATQQAHEQQEQHWQARIQEVFVILMRRLPLMHSVWTSSTERDWPDAGSFCSDLLLVGPVQ
jgi:hypothetical protein